MVRIYFTADLDTIALISKMVRKKHSKPKGETRTSFTFPSLHQNVVKAVAEARISTWYCENNLNKAYDNQYTTHVMGKFRCTNSSCSTTGWGSRKVTILIQGFAGNGYSAEVFNQRCKSCNQLGTFTLDEQSYVDRVAYRVQKWAGVRIKAQYQSSQGGIPHEREFCEGCKRGLCQQTNSWEM